MKKCIQIFAISILVFGCFTFCKSPGKGDSAGKIAIAQDSVVKDIPAFYQQIQVQNESRELENRLGLSSLEKGFKGLQIRIWDGNSLLDTLLLVTLTNIDSIWTANFYTIRYKLSDKRDSLMGFQNSTLSKSPKSGWHFFINSLYKLDIFTLPDYRIIPEYDLPSDSGGPTVEIGTSNMYRIYSLPSPYANDKIASVAKIVQIMKLVEDELGIKWL